MSGKDFYEGGDDPDKYYRPNTSTKGDFFVPPAGTTEGKMEEVSLAQQEQLYRQNVEAFGPSHEVYNSPPGNPDDHGIYHEEEIDLNAGNNTQAPPVVSQPENYKFYNIEYYQFLFNVDSKEVGQRLLRSLFPYPPNFIDTMRANPDIYGPFWITSTVVFLMFAAGNFGGYLNWVFYGNHSNKWSPNFSLVSVSAFAIYGYQIIVPLLLWIVSKFLKIGLTLLDCLCIYGYALSIYIPVAVICVAPSEIVRWVIVGVAGLISTAFLVVNFFREIRKENKWGLWIIVVITLLHVGLALTFKLYFFSSLTKFTPTNSTTLMETRNLFSIELYDIVK